MIIPILVGFAAVALTVLAMNNGGLVNSFQQQPQEQEHGLKAQVLQMGVVNMSIAGNTTWEHSKFLRGID